MLTRPPFTKPLACTGRLGWLVYTVLYLFSPWWVIISLCPTWANWQTEISPNADRQRVTTWQC